VSSGSRSAQDLVPTRRPPPPLVARLCVRRAFVRGSPSRLILLTRPPARSALRHSLRALREVRIGRRTEQPPARGPEAVLTSLTTGLERLGHPFQLNPFRISGTNVVGVLSDLDAVEAAIRWRCADGHRRLVVGPNVVVLPSQARALMTAPEIDLCVVPSEWVRREVRIRLAQAAALARLVIWV
jgi:hypothetical protein